MPTPPLAARITRPTLPITSQAFHYIKASHTDVASTFAAERQRLAAQAASAERIEAAKATTAAVPRRSRRVRAGDADLPLFPQEASHA